MGSDPQGVTIRWARREKSSTIPRDVTPHSGFGVAPSREVATGGADINIVRDQGGALIDLQQDGSRYFDLHHTNNDTLDKIDPAQLRQNVAVYTQVAGILANTREPFKPAE